VETRSPDGRLRAAFGQAQSHESLGNRTVALEILLKAEALLDEQSLQVPLHQGRETFMATRQAVISLHVDLLLEEGRAAEALNVARHARSRMLRQMERSDRLANLSPDQRARWDLLLTEYQQKRAALENRAKDAWKLTVAESRLEEAARKVEAEEVEKLLDQAFLLLGNSASTPGAALSPPQAGELILAYHPLPRGWVGFAADGKTVSVHRFDLPKGVLSRPEELSRRLLLPFHASIERARRIRILPSGPLQGVDFHALPFAGDILLASLPVVYGLDLPVPSETAQPTGKQALLVADSRGDLPGTLEEARAVKNALRGWTLEELKAAEASAEAVQGRLVTADLFHYAGHSDFSGFGGWESRLRLAEETRLTLGDLLALERVPAWVVLSACEGGRSSIETPVESLGLAQAFLLAGSRAVVASTRRADDRMLPAFFADFYREWSREPDLAVALQRAQLAWRKRNPQTDWPGFRLFEP
jgi:cellulose synthase operon protein C